jgi:3-isopropylmalate/(R)-2-methylmalate dehydratase large subunit
MSGRRVPGSDRTLFDKVWDSHVVARLPGGEALLAVDRNFYHEAGSFHAFDALRAEGRTVRKPALNFAVADHYVPTANREAGRAAIANPEIRDALGRLEDNAREFGTELIGLDDARQGIAHVIAPELGLTLPGLLITCCDSHTATNGALGALPIPIGQSNQLRHVLATQTLWQKRPRRMRITVEGVLPDAVTAKDVILAIIARIGIAGAAGHAVEYAGSAIRALSIEGRMTVCNMSIEAGARIGKIASDDTTYEYLHGRDHAPRGALWDAALAYWRTLASDEAASFEREVSLDASAFEPMVSWGTSPEDCAPVAARVPDPAQFADPDRRRRVERAIEYMGLAPGVPLESVAIDRVFIGSCTNARIEDLRAAAQVFRGRRAAVPVMISPGSSAVQRQAEADGLDRIFRDAGVEWRSSGCSMCGGSNGDLVAPGQRCASTTNRNFEGRQGRGARTHIMSPAMAAAAAVTGRLTDVRTLR